MTPATIVPPAIMPILIPFPEANIFDVVFFFSLVACMLIYVEHRFYRIVIGAGIANVFKGCTISDDV